MATTSGAWKDAENCGTISPLDDTSWVNDELERARLLRGAFYKKLTNSRTASIHEHDNKKLSKASACIFSEEFPNKPIAPSCLTARPAPPLNLDPHSSWRFYTSYDNGEWKRHCVPDVYKPEETPVSATGEVPRTAYDGNLKKYRDARATMFDRNPRQRRRTPSWEAAEEEGGFRDVRRSPIRPLGLSSCNAGSKSTNNVGGTKFQSRENFGGINVSTIKPPMQGDRQSFTTTTRVYSEAQPTNIPAKNTTNSGDDKRSPFVSQKATATRSYFLPDDFTSHVGTITSHVSRQSDRPKSKNLGFIEKIIIPTKYKTGKSVNDDRLKSATPSETDVFAEDQMNQSMSTCVSSEIIEQPTFMGSVFEKFNVMK